MLHAYRIAAAGQWPAEQGRGVVTLPSEERHRRRARLDTDRGETVLLDLPHAAFLSDGDALAVQEGGYIAVRAAFEDLVEITAGDAQSLAQLAWHIGNRHVPAEIRSDRILIREDHVIVDMLVGLGAGIRHVRTPFCPEGGAYAVEDEAHIHRGHSDWAFP